MGVPQKFLELTISIFFEEIVSPKFCFDICLCEDLKIGVRLSKHMQGYLGLEKRRIHSELCNLAKKLSSTLVGLSVKTNAPTKKPDH